MASGLFVSTDQGDRAKDIATKAHEGQVDKAGMPYIDHPRRVAERVAQVDGRPEAIAVAWLHDVVEDTATNLRATKPFPGTATASPGYQSDTPGDASVILTGDARSSRGVCPHRSGSHGSLRPPECDTPIMSSGDHGFRFVRVS